MSLAVLVILPHNPGDVVMALQAIGRLKSERPHLEFDYLVSEECRELVDGNPLIRSAHILPKKMLKESWARNDGDAAIAQVNAFLNSLAASHYGLSLNFFQERSGGIIQSWVTADRKIGLEFFEGQTFRVASRYLEHLCAIPASRRDNAWHAVDLYIRAARKALGELDAGNPARNLSDTRRKEAPPSPILPALAKPPAAGDLEESGYLVFHPGSAWAGKRWPEAHWSSLAALCHRGGIRVAFTGAPEEKPAMERILALMTPEARAFHLDCVGKTALLGAAWLLAHARLVVTGDTVAMHLAAAAGTPTLSLFGASNPIETGPYGRGHTILQTDPDPLPNLAFEQEHKGLSELRPETVAEFILEGKTPGGVSVWQTDWDEGMDMQVLRGPRREFHPNHKRAMALMLALDEEDSRIPPGAKALAGSESFTSRLPPVGETLRLALIAALERLDAAAFSELETAEQAWAAETQASLVWEAYRIASNGFSTRDIPAHLALRKMRFEQAVQEERRI